VYSGFLNDSTSSFALASTSTFIFYGTLGLGDFCGLKNQAFCLLFMIEKYALRPEIGFVIKIFRFLYRETYGPARKNKGVLMNLKSKLLSQRVLLANHVQEYGVPRLFQIIF
jgi:hypothetical protein